jgi:TFIIF-interacting CTD phosphatase-like protein
LPCKDFYIKDLSLLGRDLNRCIIVDNITENFLLQPTNGITITSFYNDLDDDALMQMCPLLISIVVAKLDDVRVALRDSYSHGRPAVDSKHF